MIVVSDASPIIGLAAVGQLDLLRTQFGRVLIPQAVLEEITAADSSAPGVREVRRESWIQVVEVKDSSSTEALALELDRGEAEAIALAIEQKADLLLLDERRARLVATRLGRPVIGVLGILVSAKQQGLLAAVAPILDDLLSEAGFRISTSLRSRVLEVVGESE